MKIPSIICVTPMMMDIFIFSEFRNGSSLFVPCQIAGPEHSLPFELSLSILEVFTCDN